MYAKVVLLASEPVNVVVLPEATNLYVVCENNHWAAINFKFEHRSYDHNRSIESYTQIKETNEEKDTIEIESPNDNCKNNKTKCPKQSAVDIANDKNILKTTKLVMELMKPWEGDGIVVNMDNYYSSPEVFVKLRQMQIYARGTFRVNRKYLPQFIIIVMPTSTILLRL